MTRTGRVCATSSSRGRRICSRTARSSPTGWTCSSPSTRSTAPWGCRASAGLMIRVTPQPRLLMAVLELTPVERALDRVAEGRTPDAAEATALLETPADRLPVLLGAASAAARPGPRPAHHLLGQGLHPADHALPRLLRLLHVPEGSRRAGRLHDDARPGAGAGPARARASAPRKRCSRSATSPRRSSPSTAPSCARVGHRTTLGYLREISAPRPGGDRPPAARQPGADDASGTWPRCARST